MQTPTVSILQCFLFVIVIFYIPYWLLRVLSLIGFFQFAIKTGLASYLEYTNPISYGLSRSLLITFLLILFSVDSLLGYSTKIILFFCLFLGFFLKRYLILANLPIYENPSIQHVNRRVTHSTWRR